MAAARLSYERMKHSFFEQSSEGFCIAVHAYRQDATNGKAKVSALELETLYVSGVTADRADKLQLTDFTHLKFLSDLARVGDESGAGCVGITLRGFGCQSCPSWRDVEQLTANGVRLPGMSGSALI